MQKVTIYKSPSEFKIRNTCRENRNNREIVDSRPNSYFFDFVTMEPGHFTEIKFFSFPENDLHKEVERLKKQHSRLASATGFYCKTEEQVLGANEYLVRFIHDGWQSQPVHDRKNKYPLFKK